MKRKTIILLSSVLAGSLLVGGAFAAYAVTDNANPIGVDVRTQAPDQDTPVEIMWGEEAHADIADLDSGKYAKAGYFTIKSSIEYKGTFSVKMADKTPQAIIDAKGTEDPVFLFDNLEVFVYSGHVVLEEGQLPAELPEGVELVGSISTNTPKQEDGSKLWSELVTTDLDGKVFTVLVKSEATDAVLGQLSQDVVGITVDWGMGPDSHEATPTKYSHTFECEEDVGQGRGIFLVGEFNEWTLNLVARMEYGNDKWSKTLELEEGTYKYKFVIADYDDAQNADWTSLNVDDRIIDIPGGNPQPSEKTYYLVGSFNEWEEKDEDNALVKNPTNDKEYWIGNVNFEAGAEFKVMDSSNVWYPDGMDNNYVVEVAGAYDVYFRPDGQGGENWHQGYIYIEVA